MSQQTEERSFSVLSERPSELGGPGAAGAWFARIAAHLLGACRLRAAGSLHRLVEIEFYFHSVEHPDPFAHCHAEQRTRGHWYFHRMGPSFRGGSFKGVDLTFGDGVAHGGILVRSLETPEGKLVVGPSLCVDYLLKLTGFSSVEALHRAINGRPASDPEALLHLADGDPVEHTLFRSARVGLSLKRHCDATAVDLLARPYRFLTDPRRVTKGRSELITALLAEGRSPEEIQKLTGSPMKTILKIRKYRETYKAELDDTKLKAQELPE